MDSDKAMQTTERQAVLTRPQMMERFGKWVETTSAERNRPLDILEAGCGRTWTISTPDVAFTLTGIDIDRDALRSRVEIVKDLDVAVCGDIVDPEVVGESTFDVIYSAFMLEHVHNAAAAMENFARWLRPGGIMLLQIPDRRTVPGWAAMTTPFSVHVAYHRYVRGNRNAATAGHGPYPTVYDPIVGSSAIRAFAGARGLQVLEEWRTDPIIFGLGRRNDALVVGCKAAAVLSLGRLKATHMNLGFVLGKPAS